MIYWAFRVLLFHCGVFSCFLVSISLPAVCNHDPTYECHSDLHLTSNRSYASHRKSGYTSCPKSSLSPIHTNKGWINVLPLILGSLSKILTRESAKHPHSIFTSCRFPFLLKYWSIFSRTKCGASLITPTFATFSTYPAIIHLWSYHIVTRSRLFPTNPLPRLPLRSTEVLRALSRSKEFHAGHFALRIPDVRLAN